MSRLSIYKGDDAVFSGAVTDDFGMPIDLRSNAEVRFSASRDYDGKDQVLTKIAEVAEEEPGNVYRVLVTGTDTESMDVPAFLIFTVRVYYGSGVRQTVDSGPLSIFAAA